MEMRLPMRIDRAAVLSLGLLTGGAMRAEEPKSRAIVQSRAIAQSRAIVPEQFVTARPAKTSAPAAASTAAYHRVGSPAGSKTALKVDALTISGDTRQLGLTIWLLRASKAADSGARILVHDPEGTAAYTPERISPGAPLRIGDRVRLSIESAQKGHLYVIDQERHADGTLGEAYLIFPTARTRSGDNQVVPGRLIEIPAQEDRPNYFRMKQSRPDQTGEELTLLVTPEPLEGITIGSDPLVLPAVRVKEWESKWGKAVDRFELSGGAGKTWTKEEQQAGLGGTRLLTQDEPGPQTIYRATSGPTNPLLVKLNLNYRIAPRK